MITRSTIARFVAILLSLLSLPHGRALGQGEEANPGEVSSVAVGDAFVHGSAKGRKWEIGTGALRLSFEVRNGKLFLSSFKNQLAHPPREYADAGSVWEPLSLGALSVIERYSVKELWTSHLPVGASVNPAVPELRVKVRKGEMLGFAAGPHGSYYSDEVQWPVTLVYEDGETFSSAQDTKLDQGPVWYYCVRMPDTGFLDFMDTIERHPTRGETMRLPSSSSGYRAPEPVPHAGPTLLHPSHQYDAVRVWKAPKDGTVTISGTATGVSTGDTDVMILEIVERTDNRKPAQPEQKPWDLVRGTAHKVGAGGRPAVQLDLELKHEALRVVYHVLAYPGTALLQQWADLENTGGAPLSLKGYKDILSLKLSPGDDGPLTAYWMIGGNSQPDQGKMHAEQVGASYHRGIASAATGSFVPWIALHRTGADGLFVALDFIGQWRLGLDREPGEPMVLSARLPEMASKTLAPGQHLRLPTIRLGVFHRDLDDMAARLYNWQYEYLWDYTHDDWFALMEWTTACWYGATNLQEQFAGRLAYSDMDWADYLRESGMEVIWDDAGWSANPDIWFGNREGPDYAQTARYLAKGGMKRALWFPGDPTAGIMDTKVGSWGDFQWRTDGLGFTFDSDPAFRREVTDWLRKHPRSSWHTCSGGSTYSHTFDIQRYGDVHYDTDGPGSDITNFYFSYLETPDKWFDNLATWQPERGGLKYFPDISRRMLTMAPKWGLYITTEDLEQMRLIADLYHYLLKEGVAGRWSLVAHPVVQGDTEHYYLQRLNSDRTKSLIVLKHQAKGTVTLYPRGLQPNQPYRVEWDSGKPGATVTGADLMAHGLKIQNQVPGELIYLNLPHRPRSGRDSVPPSAPERVLTRRETSIGHTGVAIYWSPGADNNWISYYEVSRNGKLLGKTGTGTFFFDRAAEWDPRATYAVRTVDGDENRSGWTQAESLFDDPLTYAGLGGHYSDAGRNGWRAELSTDGISFQPMTWIPPAGVPTAEVGGTPNQRGGAEGYWEGGGTARCGRGWQQASSAAMCLRTWVAPKAGTVRIVGRAMKEYYHQRAGEALRVKILHGRQQIWPGDGWAEVALNDLTGQAHDLSVPVAAGDAIRFVLDRSAVPDNALLAWMPSIVYVDTVSTTPAPEPVRILCGARNPYTDQCGNVWSADRFYARGKPAATRARIEGALPTSEDQTLYQSGRVGRDFAYAIPVASGLYTVRLKFAEPTYDWFFERPFNVRINGRLAMRNVDICQAARGPRKAHERVFRYVVPDAQGKINLRFTAGWEPLEKTDEAMVQAIEVLSELKPVIRVDCGAANPFIDWNSDVWAKDSGFEGGTTLRAEAPVDQASPTLYDQDLYRTARTGRTIGYRFSLPPGLYTVHLKFAELWLKETGARPMNIEINRRLVWKSWDPAAQAGKVGMSADLRAQDITPDRAGQITIRVDAAGINDAVLQAIEIE